MRTWLLAGVVLAACGGPSETGPDAGLVDGGACATPLDADTLASLTHSFWAAPVIEARPGDQRDLDLGTVGLGAAFEVVPACATWSIAPTAGATIDPTTGVLVIDAGTASGTAYVVTADVESGRRTITADVIVYTEAAMPWHGTWRESVELACGTGAEVTPEEAINEIRFWADGTLWVTWFPFEVYVDYWGTYAFEPGAGTVTLTAEGGNYVPADIDGTGTFELAGGTLVLRDLWLGSPQGGTAPAQCGHELIRF
jgi:hypothetical protein